MVDERYIYISFYIILLTFLFSSRFSGRMLAVSGLYVRRAVQKVGRRFRDTGTGRRLQRGLHLVHFDTPGVAKRRHRHVYAVPLDTDLHGPRRHVTRVGHESRVNIVPKVRLQGGGVCSGLLRQVHAAEFARVSTCSVLTFKQMIE